MKSQRLTQPARSRSTCVTLGERCEIDEGVLLGYRTGRQIASQDLIIASGARLRSGTVVYVGSRIGRNFQTGHNVTIREENTIGDDVSIWANSVVDYGCHIGDRVKIHILLIFISIFGGLATFGLLGIIFGPLITIAFLSLVEIYHQGYGKQLY